ncbi:nickel pincer cofactor biosynthesis protein LarC [Pseudofrankia sp. DC12]|uniref:nickel pincer cofactor biosynthesis protein LarC n=1 Tax=Pseudofrankia sp. DC12 TaxID=683315 RepID=UPI0005F78319|nr:nickel pincer cofactor biosynthesis protein LarC [Pseudofrankia sp. DC12]
MSGPEPPAARRVGWLDLSCGASGDMLLGALVDAGVPLAVPAAAIDGLGLPIRLEARQVHRSGLAATKVDVVAPDTGHTRTWADIRVLLARAPLADATRDLAIATFAALATAEGLVHGIDPAEVHFHEVGALDAIADIVGVSAGFAQLGLDGLVATPIALGGGRARTAHGVLPIPGPAVLELLRAAGAPAVGGPVPVELCTPTGAALVVTVATHFGDLPALRVTAVGCGAGTRDLPGRPNLVRLVVGDALDPTVAAPGAHRHQAHDHLGHDHADDEHPGLHSRHAHDAGSRAGRRGPPTGEPPAEGVAPSAQSEGGLADGVAVTAELVLEANVDDLDPRVWPSVLAALLTAGAADAWLTPILMKKGRPAHTLRALVAPASLPAVRAAIFQHTSTLGLREIQVRKHALARSMRAVEVAGHPVRVKVSPGPGPVGDLGEHPPGPVPVAQPEWEDVALAAEKLGWPARAVLAAACALAYEGRWSDVTPGSENDRDGTEPAGPGVSGHGTDPGLATRQS